MRLRVISVKLIPSQSLNSNNPVQFVLVLSAKISRRVLSSQYPDIVITPQHADQSSNGISLEAVIPSSVNTNIYSSLSVQFQNLSSSPSSNGALISDGVISYNLSDSSNPTQNNYGIMGEVISILGLFAFILYGVYKKPYKV
jgi:hypothetical protein